jgi:predicted DNA-binding transcriptional regulator YafY
LALDFIETLHGNDFIISILERVPKNFNANRAAADPASVIECHPRTLYRDLEALQAAGFPIYTERVEGKNLWSLLDTLKHHIPIPFSLTELMALYWDVSN